MDNGRNPANVYDRLRMISPRKLDPTFYANVVGQIYESALNPARWRDVIEALEGAFLRHGSHCLRTAMGG